MAQSIFHKLIHKKEDEKEKFVLGITVKPVKTNVMRIESMNMAAESVYFWYLDFLRNEAFLGYQVEKMSDVYSASEASSFFGHIEQRKASQQDRISQFMQTIGGMTKSLFQMVRELRIVDERLDYYVRSSSDEGAEIALKGIWIDLVEGGAENPTSVIGMARRLGFVTLPDLFFHIHPKDGVDGVDREVEALEGINERVKDILKRKLFQYYEWKEKTWKEHDWRRNFVLKSLKQHYESILMYVHWIKPLLRNVARLEMSQEGKYKSPDLITAFESNTIDLEIFGVHGSGYYSPCIRVKFRYVAMPEMAFQREYQRGAVHAGRVEVVIEGYALSKEQIEEYKKSLKDEEFEILKTVNASLEALGDELKRYLAEAGEIKEEEPVKKQKFGKGVLEPFTSVYSGFKELFGGLKPSSKEKEEKEPSSYEKEITKDDAEDKVKGNVYSMYDIYKKAHQMLSW